MKVLVVGGGGREHALCWKLARSPLLSKLYCAPGNPGIAEIAERVPIAVEEISRLADFAAERLIDLTVVGPEVPLALGLADELHARGLAVFGPSQLAAELEGSKVFAKLFMARHGIPTARFALAHTAEEARAAQPTFGFPVVVKADGLAAGKGVFLPADEGEFEQALEAIFAERRFGDAGDRVVIEECLAGEEVSFMGLSDGERVLPLATAKDYKRIGDGDLGPNTGGMGCHSPSGILSAQQAAEVVERVLKPTVAGMAAEGRRFVGVVYAGLMITSDGPRVLEFNARFGDPEAQVLMMRLEDDLLPVLAAGAAGKFEQERLTFRPETAGALVLASPGYPDRPTTGEPIRGLDRAEALPEIRIFHAGTATRETEDGPSLVSSGGRVLNVCALGADLSEALDRAYAAASEIDWPGKVFRRDIGRRVLEGARFEPA
ncbi:MAG TPA: phosphoribosylamine--glycine ligase [Thermoanaerobaculia bacterium]|jgi:phosphoribosylamine--glycine ligase|nr:phosphoribosylamine--glycine ligase [Thermoanaerobaculia bacterium]